MGLRLPAAFVACRPVERISLSGSPYGQAEGIVHCHGLPPQHLVQERQASTTRWSTGVSGARGHLRAFRARRGRESRVVRRVFDSGGFFGVGIAEALVIGLLSWFLLGPRELFRIAKRAGAWLGELRGFVAQTAKEYEKALDDEGTRKAIEGIRATQRTVVELGSQWQNVANSMRDPLNLGTVLSSSYEEKASSVLEDTTVTRKDREEAKERIRKQNAEEAERQKKGDESKQPSGAKSEETEEELAAKVEASRKAAENLWYAQDEDASAPGATRNERLLQRLDAKLDEMSELLGKVEDVRLGLIEDRKVLKDLVEKDDASTVTSKAADKAEPSKGSRQAVDKGAALVN